jgi:hypothetical protein
MKQGPGDCVPGGKAPAIGDFAENNGMASG